MLIPIAIRKMANMIYLPILAISSLPFGYSNLAGLTFSLNYGILSYVKVLYIDYYTIVISTSQVAFRLVGMETLCWEIELSLNHPPVKGGETEESRLISMFPLPLVGEG